MANGVYIGMSAALAAERRLEVVANNIANADSPGFRQQRAVFKDYLVATLDGSPEQKGFTAINETVLDRAPGPVRHTGRPLDLAIEGDGFFVVRSPQGLLVSRAGNFRTTTDGTLVDASGLPVQAGTPEGGFTPINVRPNGGPVRVGSDGTIAQDGIELARIAVVTADGPGLTPTGGSHFQAAPGALRTADAPGIASGFLEGSNVNAIRGMVELIQIGHDSTTAQKLMTEQRKLDRAVMSIAR